MASYRILAQHMLSSTRIVKIVQAKSQAQALQMVYHELFEANYYPLSATLVA